MSIVKPEYKTLGPSLMLLSDVTVLAQAWKKSHQYIRRHNWYADVLELDASAINLEKRLSQWAELVTDTEFKPAQLRLVPAPKNQTWVFNEWEKFNLNTFLDMNLDDIGSEPNFNDWHPTLTDDIAVQPLRPLAHVNVRDQVLNTAVMLCLANAIETAQGDPGLDAMAAREAGMVSYGNRLHCHWRDGTVSHAKIAVFAWGNSRTYSDYFQHYQAFLARPAHVCRELSGQLAHDKELFVVKLDIKAFFDGVNRDALIFEMKRLETLYRGKTGDVLDSDDDQDYLQFWDAVARLSAWEWSPDDDVHKTLFNGDSGLLPLGLPQGLVASGFFANAYLQGFDQLMAQAVSRGTAIGSDACILDYCRYVDDMRVVVSAPTNARASGLQAVLKSAVEGFVEKLLKKHFDDVQSRFESQSVVIQPLKLNTKKSEIQSYRSMGQQGGLSATMRSLNAGLSGTFDLDSLVMATGGLDGLLWLSAQLDDTNPVKPSRLRLAAVASPVNDVRDDTVKRFVATRLVKVLRERLAMADNNASTDDGLSPRGAVTTDKTMSHEFERMARKLIKVWSENPSLVLLLRCGLDLFPHPKLLETVTQALELKLQPPKKDKDKAEVQQQVHAARYVIADLLRAGAVETGHRGNEAYPSGVDITGYRQCLAALAKRVLVEKASPWYVKQQAYLFLSSIADVSMKIIIKGASVELLPYLNLQKALRYRAIEASELLDALPLALVVQQIKPNPTQFASWFTAQLELDAFDEAEEAIEVLALSSPDLLMACLAHRSTKQRQWFSHVPSGMREFFKETGMARSKKRLPEKSTLLRAISNHQNPFENENSILALARALLLHITNDDIEGGGKKVRWLGAGLSAEHINLASKDWDTISALGEETLIAEILDPGENVWSLYQPPPWVRENRAWLYGLGRILRSAVTGEMDFTARRFLLSEDIQRYSGLRSTWFQRRFGLVNNGRGLYTEPSPVTPWLSSFLTALLQWPGTFVRGSVASEIGQVGTPHELLKIVQTRIASQRALYGGRSKTPFYVLPTSDSLPQHRAMRVAVVQTLRPALRDFDAKDPLHWTPADLAAHRRHLAEMCKLTHAKISAWASSREKSNSADSGEPLVDLILFPELTIHEEHIDFLRRLSDSVGANIFAGLTFVHSHKAGGITNQGLWLIRTQFEGDGRQIEYVRQGKKFPMKLERQMGVKQYRPHVTLVEFPVGQGAPTRVAAAICYDATDLDLVADLRDRSDMFIVAAMNQDVQTFDNMVSALHFHMYQPVILANSGEFGGSTAQAPFPKHEKTIAQVHGGNQVAVSVFEIEPWHFKETNQPSPRREVKTPPAGYQGRRT
ncbi:RNA-directed DNA polymerase [Rhodoferax sp. U2-2l]|uniref:RNA-directed DNA polymerase n=1 Tax=Rhodoferax sp. U2-2l TaxID=2884000 RepID=UPI001D0B0491|nr:RNA-directed DNA polymerase [Rhodoferax sp. U2-2l]MCB8747287.1 RNA-directed DNA polymerase [Rhodoferax sp. U2-2l]